MRVLCRFCRPAWLALEFVNTGAIVRENHRLTQAHQQEVNLKYPWWECICELQRFLMGVEGVQMLPRMPRSASYFC